MVRQQNYFTKIRVKHKLLEEKKTLEKCYVFVYYNNINFMCCFTWIFVLKVFLSFKIKYFFFKNVCPP